MIRSREVTYYCGTLRARGREEEVSRGRGKERRKDVEEGEVVGSGQK
jgi:hypothetical protein